MMFILTAVAASLVAVGLIYQVQENAALNMEVVASASVAGGLALSAIGFFKMSRRERVGVLFALAVVIPLLIHKDFEGALLFLFVIGISYSPFLLGYKHESGT